MEKPFHRLGKSYDIWPAAEHGAIRMRNGDGSLHSAVLSFYLKAPAPSHLVR